MSNNLAHTLIDRGLEPEANTKAEPAQYRALAGKIAKKTATVAVCGMGYVGLPLARAITEQGFPVIGLDIDNEKVEKLNSGHSYIKHIPHPDIQSDAQNRSFPGEQRFRRDRDCRHHNNLCTYTAQPLPRARSFLRHLHRCRDRATSATRSACYS